jgi:hypothetical protein
MHLVREVNAMEEFWTWFSILVGGGSVLVAILATVLGGLCTLLPFVAIGWYIWSRAKQRDAVRTAALAWQTTTGRVLKSRVEVSGGDNASVSPRVVYAYDVNGRAYQSDQIRAGDKIMTISSSGDAYQTIDRYPAGSIVTVYYNPANPQEAALER